jgi:hypothetical protein
MTTEKMTIRKALKEKKVLDNRIQELKDFGYVTYYTNDNKFIGAMTPEDTTTFIKANMDKLNSMLARREAINKAILDINAKALIKVKKFVSFDHIGQEHEDEYEEISLANAINRKAYYNGMILPLLKIMERNALRKAQEFNTATTRVQSAVEEQVRQRFGSNNSNTNTSLNKFNETFNEAYKEALEAKKVVLIDPLNATVTFHKYVEYVEDYINNIDSELSNKTETIEVEFTY